MADKKELDAKELKQVAGGWEINARYKVICDQCGAVASDGYYTEGEARFWLNTHESEGICPQPFCKGKLLIEEYLIDR